MAEAGQSTLGTVTITDPDGTTHTEERMLGAVTIATNMAGRGTDIKALARGEGRRRTCHHRH